MGGGGVGGGWFGWLEWRLEWKFWKEEVDLEREIVRFFRRFFRISCGFLLLTGKLCLLLLFE